MLHRLLAFPTVALVVALSAPDALAQDPPPPMQEAMQELAAADLAWNAAEVPGFLPGMEIAALHGDPSVPDQPYTLRLAFPDGYAFPPHWHPRAENVTVLEGTFLLAMGRSFDESQLKTYQPGDYLYIEAENPHFGKVQGRTVLQLHGIGPFDIVVVEGQEMTP